jgi:glyoxylase-like metal-dependent hydrolase (beta-lactamase superfamily II)
MTIRACVVAFAVLLSLPAAAQNPFGIETEWEELAPNVYGVREGTGRSLVLVTGEGVIYIDPLNPRAAAAGLKYIREVTDEPIKYVIYSHQHWDHILGAQVLKDEGATIISHEACLKHFTRHPHPDLVMPDRAVGGNATISLGDVTMELLYYGANHGDCLLVPWFPDLKMPFIVDLVTPGFIGLPTMPDYDPGEWVRTLKEVELLPFENFMSAHATAIAPKSALVERRMFLEDIMAIVKRELDAGTPAQEIAGKIDLPQYSHLAGYGTAFPGMVTRLRSYYVMGW